MRGQWCASGTPSWAFRRWSFAGNRAGRARRAQPTTVQSVLSLEPARRRRTDGRGFLLLLFARMPSRTGNAIYVREDFLFPIFHSEICINLLDLAQTLTLQTHPLTPGSVAAQPSHVRASRHRPPRRSPAPMPRRPVGARPLPMRRARPCSPAPPAAALANACTTAPAWCARAAMPRAGAPPEKKGGRRFFRKCWFTFFEKCRSIFFQKVLKLTNIFCKFVEVQHF